MVTNELRAALRRQRLLAIVRGSQPDACLRSIAVLADEGITLVEVSLTTIDALSVIEQAASAHPAVLLGAGTIRTQADARDSRNAGAQFAVTPGRTPGVAHAAELGMPVLVGCLSPTEIHEIHSDGHIPKLFPASAVGPGFVRALSDPFPDIDVVPVGGVDVAAAAQHLAAGALAVGVGSPLLGDAPVGGDLDALAQRAREFQALVSETGQ